MDDWKKKADAYLERKQYEGKERKSRPQEDSYEQRMKVKLNPNNYPILLAIYHMLFRCHVCGKVFSPRIYGGETGGGQSWGHGSGGSYHTMEYIAWTSKPWELERCMNCHRLACSGIYGDAEHIHAGICQTCAEKL